MVRNNTRTSCSECDLMKERCVELENVAKAEKIERIRCVQEIRMLRIQNSLFREKIARQNETLRKAHSLNSNLRTQISKLTEDPYRVFEPDQMKMLQSSTGRVRNWSNTTIVRSLQKRFACGRTAYEKLRNDFRDPVPSIRTLQRKIENIRFLPGPLIEILYLMKVKSESIEPRNRICGLIFDEMAIEMGREFCKNTQRIFGDTTIRTKSSSSEPVLASNALIAVLVGKFYLFLD